MFDGLFELLSYLESKDPRDEDGDSTLGYYERQYEGPAYRDAAARLREVIGQIGEGRKALREDVETVIRNAYNDGWRESKKWPNHPHPPEIEVVWGQPGGLAIKEHHPSGATSREKTVLEEHE